MSSPRIKTRLWLFLLLAVIPQCSEKPIQLHSVRTALADSLVAVVDRAMAAVEQQRFPDFMQLIDPKVRPELDRMVTRQGYSSLKAYLAQQMHGWPQTDTLVVTDLVWDTAYARITFSGAGTKYGRKPTVRYTIVMLKLTQQGWRMNAMTSFEKEAYDQYGNRLTFHETELPSKLRFPRPL
jgi:hypothetical protein